MYGPVRTVVWADGRGNSPSDPIDPVHDEDASETLPMSTVPGLYQPA